MIADFNAEVMFSFCFSNVLLLSVGVLFCWGRGVLV